MQKQVFGFISIAEFVNNQPGQISPLGELSTWSQTYSTTKGEYADSLYPGKLLTTFSVTDTVNGEDTTLAQAEASLSLKVVDECIKYALNNPLPLDPVDFRDYIQAELVDDIQSLGFGELVQGPGISLPGWIEYTQKAADNNIVKIWLADVLFKAEYPDYDIVIVPPHDDLNIFAGNWQNAVNKLSEWNTARLIEELQAKKNLNPETYVRYYEFDFVNKNNPTQRKATPWYILVYGEAGDNDDAVKDAIIELLVSSTGRDEFYWEPIFPELFRRTEFALYPRWDRLSIPNVSTLTSLYSPFVNIKNTTEYLNEKCTFYPPTHIADNMFSFPVTYKSIEVNGVNGPNNVNEQLSIEQVWPDFINVDTSSPDFQRMQPLTQEWVHFMIKSVIAAETATTTSALPQGMRRVKRGDLQYISGNFNKATYLTCMRRNFVR